MIIKSITSNIDALTVREHFANIADYNKLTAWWSWGNWGEMVVSLLDYLEHEAEAPPQWVRVSGVHLLFAEQETDFKGRVVVTPYPRRPDMVSYKYGVYSRLAKPWRFGEGIATDAVSAGELIVEGLRRAVEVDPEQSNLSDGP